MSRTLQTIAAYIAIVVIVYRLTEKKTIERIVERSTPNTDTEPGFAPGSNPLRLVS